MSPVESQISIRAGGCLEWIQDGARNLFRQEHPTPEGLGMNSALRTPL